MDTIENRLKELGLELPESVAPLYSYVPVTVHQGTAYVSGQVPRIDGRVPYSGKVGKDVTVEQARELAEYCVLKGLSVLKAEVGSLDRVEQVLKVTGFVQTAPGFYEPSKVLDAASELLVKIFGEKGRHARSAIGAAELPDNTPVEIEFIFAVNLLED
ncbi:Enamine deaminase RidA, house cleaning of reactive enamine intermediates, YjgF/YER057c/UK114 family [Bhargavaea ginsengi]|uniref:Enamine deaminase RidA, house cleaning of reactive enamine intermediates, YjgF/YER057c/UK114 family n=1 Tax=Bhargavaea ginsengi TaxID=426757 RepID=A0A1H6YWT8_9BACL|nr:RidA family protein [Bhargavaea ginsengi]SEJ45733.1 Enamine deaminase RidA, house cleaning of reactive enamine intermediates, YjgF/YER057c/UK114 family [Bhargavaea ginsengi]